MVVSGGGEGGALGDFFKESLIAFTLSRVSLGGLDSCADIIADRWGMARKLREAPGQLGRCSPSP